MGKGVALKMLPKGVAFCPATAPSIANYKRLSPSKKSAFCCSESFEASSYEGVEIGRPNSACTALKTAGGGGSIMEESAFADISEVELTFFVAREICLKGE